MYILLSRGVFMGDSEQYINSLRTKIEILQQETIEDKKRVQELLKAIGFREEQIEYIRKLLEAEGVALNGYQLNSALILSVSDMAYEVLSKQEEHKPIHYRDLAEMIMTEGKLIPGKDPAANLIAHLSRDERFVRTAPGTYALSEWGYKPLKKRRIRKKK